MSEPTKSKVSPIGSSTDSSTGSHDHTPDPSPETDSMAFPAGFFDRQDETPDSNFYVQPRLVTHIDDATIAAITAWYQEILFDGAKILDLMSSWISHLPATPKPAHVSGLGMNEQELQANPVLDDWVVHDLNLNPILPYADEQFDFVFIVVSIQYLTQPVEVFTDIARVLKPGGRLGVSMSHRCFPTKAVRAFQVLDAQDRIRLVAEYMKRAGSKDQNAFNEPEFLDRSPSETGQRSGQGSGLRADPAWIVTATRRADCPTSNR